MSAPELLDDLVDVPGAAALLHVSEACVRKWCSTGRLPRYKAGMRSCIPDGAPIREEDLRGYLPDVDACLEGLRRADGHHNKDELEAA